jgi:KUP system potassium uptake protein
MTKVDLKEIIEEFNHAEMYYLPNSAAIFVTDPYDQSGGSFLHHLKQMQILPENILIVSVVVENYPHISPIHCFEVIKISKRIYRLILHFGFMQIIDLPKILKYGNDNKYLPFSVDMEQIPYLVETIEINLTRKQHPGLFFWQKKIFKILLRNSAVDFKFFHLPHSRTISIGTTCNI